MAANQWDFGRFVERLMVDAEANFPLLAPIRVTRDLGRDVWHVMTRTGAFEFTERAVGPGRRGILDFMVYQLSRLHRVAEHEDRQRNGPMELRIGDVITVNGREARIVAIAPGCVTVDQLGERGLVEVAGCNCRDCRNQAALRRQMADTGRDAAQYAAAMWNAPDAPPIAPAVITPEAERRSMELLRRNLTPEQLRQWDRDQEIEVRGQSGARYRIRGQIGAYNIQKVDGGRLCCTPGYPGELPLGDYVLGQKLALELDEQRFLREANHAGDLGGGFVDEPEPGRPIAVTQRDLNRLFRETYVAEIGRF